MRILALPWRRAVRDINPRRDTSNARWQRNFAELAIPLNSRVRATQLEKQLQ
jgi:hypothetical protein